RNRWCVGDCRSLGRCRRRPGRRRALGGCPREGHGGGWVYVLRCRRGRSRGSVCGRGRGDCGGRRRHRGGTFVLEQSPVTLLSWPAVTRLPATTGFDGVLELDDHLRVLGQRQPRHVERVTPTLHDDLGLTARASPEQDARYSSGCGAGIEVFEALCIRPPE